MKISDLVHSTNTTTLQPIAFTLPDEEDETSEIDSADGGLEVNIRARRVVVPPQQKDYLESIFQVTPYPDNELKRELADKFKTTPRKIQVWFQNRRQKQRIENG
ncbi:aristaless-related homeobox protein-like [Planoprotostelium fungivorum]|uniref:Aristaless-related homeobox protein-like n=1 Tax=Planoprotostelium fungivorum TaxID=1890364 RepID=A0A2P6MZN4_9EUKA|nr:aristaless-related homeobox protein-like [Planoprotostelium fungivorum]